LHDRRALRARALNMASVAASVFMNAIAAAPGWRNLAIWAMPPVAYALASDTLITVVRTRHQQLAVDAATPAGRPRRWTAAELRHRPVRVGTAAGRAVRRVRSSRRAAPRCSC